MSYLEFVTLNTGETSRIRPPDPVVTSAAALDLRRALDAGTSPITAHPGHTLQASPVGSALLCSILQGEVPLTTFGAAARSRHAGKLWSLLFEGAERYGYAIDRDDMPPVPWCAVRVEPSLVASSGEPWRWLAAYEVEIATAWVQKRHTGP